MTDSSSKSEDRARLIVGWAALLGGILGALLSMAIGEGQRRALFDQWQRAAPRTIAADKVAVVLIDNESIDSVGPWPWPRYYMARLTEQIARQNPKVIAFDMTFPTSDAFSPRIFASLYPEFAAATIKDIAGIPDMDTAFAEVIGSNPVLLPRLVVDEEGSDPAHLLIDPVITGTPPARTLSGKRVLTSLPQLDDVALAHAVINGPPDSDGIIRRVPLTVLAGGQSLPGMAVDMARIAAGLESLAWQGANLHFGARLLPADETGSLMLRMGRFPDNATFHADEALAGKIVDPAAFTGKVVLIGLGADGTADVVPTPLTNFETGVFIQAQAVDAILGGGWLSRPAWIGGTEWGAALLLVTLTVFAGGSRRYRWLVVGVALAAALWGASFLVFDRANLLFDPLRPTLIAVSAAAAMGITLFVLARAERARLAAALTEQRVSAAEQEGELKAARRIQMGMVPNAASLTALDPRAEIGAVLRPAKSVGGDFYDALMLGPDRLLFVVGDVTGKGVPAALYMALSKALSKSVLSRSVRDQADGDLGEAVAALNRELMAEADDEMGVTMLVGVLDCATGEIAFVNAGHENPLVVRADGTVETLSLRGGPPFCVVDFPYPEERAKLNPADTLVLITDGATEAQDATQALLGLEGVIAALRGEGEMPATERAGDLADRIRAFEGDTEPSDDLTIVAIRFRGG